MNNTIELESLTSLVRDGITLVIGSEATANGDEDSRLTTRLREKFGGSELIDNLGELFDALLEEEGGNEEDMRKECILELKSEIHISPDIRHLLQASIIAIVDLSCNDNVRVRHNEIVSSGPVGWRLSTISSDDMQYPPRTIPYYRLLGDPDDRRENNCLVLSKSGYLMRKLKWPQMLSTLADATKGNPVILLGHRHNQDRLLDFLTELHRGGPKMPRRLYFLESDPVFCDPTIKAFLKSNFSVSRIRGSCQDIGECFSRERLSIRSLPLWRNLASSGISSEDLAAIENQVSYVPKTEEVTVNPSARNHLLDCLFRPQQLNWEPYVLGLPFERDVVREIEQIVDERLTRDSGSNVIRIIGETGIGKTIIMRSLAYNMAQKVDLCLWVRRKFDIRGGEDFSSVVKTINKGMSGKGYSVCFVIDDPIGSRVSEIEIVNSLGSAHFKWVMVVCCRKSDAAISGQIDYSVEVPQKFTESEWGRFPEYLVSLNVASDVGDASRILSNFRGAGARDILCNLYYALPQTRSAIQQSIEGEHDRLSGLDSYIEAFVGKGGGSRSIARNAYELVAVASGHGETPVPIEVLVGAIGVSYEDWTKNCGENSPIWGLIYELESGNFSTLDSCDEPLGIRPFPVDF